MWLNFSKMTTVHGYRILQFVSCALMLPFDTFRHPQIGCAAHSETKRKIGDFFRFEAKKIEEIPAHPTHKTSSYKSPVTKVQLPNVQLKNVQLQNVQVTKRPGSQTSIFVVITERVEDEGRELEQGLPVR
jgi:hypothetical protein